jgi:hypothetical protein
VWLPTCPFDHAPCWSASTLPSLDKGRIDFPLQQRRARGRAATRRRPAVEDDGRQAVARCRECQEGARYTRAVVRRHRIQCDFAARQALYLAGNLLDATALREEGRQRRAIGLPSAYLGANDLLGLTGMDREAALLSDGVAELDPVRLATGLLRRAVRAGSRVFSLCSSRK